MTLSSKERRMDSKPQYGIIPYLVAILVAVGVFRASGAMDLLIQGIKWCVEQCGLDTRFVDALPTAFYEAAFWLVVHVVLCWNQ